MISSKRILVGVTGILLIAGGIGASIAASEGGGREGRMQGGWQGRSGGDDQGSGMGRGGPRAPLTDEELDTRVRERFARIDRNSDGIIDKAEVEAMMSDGRRGGEGRRMRGGDKSGGERSGRILQRFDENRDGKVTKEEFINGIKRRFAEMDLDGDGKITEADLPPILRGSGVLTGVGRLAMEGGDSAMGRGMRAGGQRGGGERREMGGGMGPMIAWLRAADANRDGVITLEEAVAHADKQFARLDRNGDGIVDQADRDLMRKEMTDYRVLRFLHRFGAGKEGKISREQFTKVAKERMARMDDTMGGFEDRGRRGHMGGGRHSDETGFGFRRGRRGADGEPKADVPAAQPQPGPQPGQPGSPGSPAKP